MSRSSWYIVVYLYVIMASLGNNNNSKPYKTKSSKKLRNDNLGPNPLSTAAVTASDKAAMESFNLLLQQVTINLSSKSKHEMLELRKKLQAELDLVRVLVSKIEARERKPNPLPQLTVSVEREEKENEKKKEKRTPKANKLYRNSEFLLANDKEKNLKNVGNVKKSELSSKDLKNCSALLERLIKHKHGWVFSAPVDPVSLGLRDYLEIIKNPMDLGTVKSRLDTNWYKSPKEFAEDVRLTFKNAMTYNPKGQDVHVMAELLLNIFEEKWVAIESEYMQESRMALKTHEAMGLTTPKKMKKSDSFRKAPAPKKPKARDPNKREMTYEEKQKLSFSLQNLPSDKLDDVVKIIKKRNSSLCQSEDEIEIDIDSVDTETLWELDRFVTNYKKILSKNKRKAELGVQDRPETAHVQNEILAPVVMEEQKEAKSDENNVSSTSPAPVEQQGENANKSSSASSSSAGGSGSSSSDSDGESSSEDGPGAGHSVKKQL